MRRVPAIGLLALGSGLVVVALLLGPTRSSNTPSSAFFGGSPDAPGVGMTGLSSGSAPKKMVGIARPVRIPALRTLKSKPARYGRVPETDFESYPARQPGSSTHDTVVQRTALR